MTKDTMTLVVADEISPSTEARIAEAQDTTTSLATKDAGNAKALAAQLGYLGPVDPDSLEALAKDRGLSLQRGIYEYGAALLMLREATLHGDWTERCERLGISHSSAHRYMSIAARFKDSDAARALQALGMGKMLELAALDDGEIDAFTKGETVRGLTFDAVDSMSLKELRKKVRSQDGDIETKDRQIADKDRKINELDRKLNARKVVAYTDWPEAFKGLIAQAQQAKRELLNAVDALAVIRQDAMQVQAESPAEEEVLGRARIALADEMQDIFAIAGGKLEKEAQVFDNTLQAVADDHREGSK